MSARPVEIADRDAVVIIGMLAVLSGPLLAETLDETLFIRLRGWLAQQGLISEHASQRNLSIALQDIVDRLRHARGEYEES